jgi:hypothetical protein
MRGERGFVTPVVEGPAAVRAALHVCRGVETNRVGGEVADGAEATQMAQVDLRGTGRATFEDFKALLYTNRPASRSRYGWIKSPTIEPPKQHASRRHIDTTH